MNEGQKIVASRDDVYGDPVESFERIAKVWSGILGIEVQPWQVPLCQAGLKLVRTGITPDYSDNSDDVDGFMEIFRKIIGSDMVEAKLVSDYLAQKNFRTVEAETPVLFVPVDTYTHMGLPRSGTTRVCTWDRGNECWVYDTGNALHRCELEHP